MPDTYHTYNNSASALDVGVMTDVPIKGTAATGDLPVGGPVFLGAEVAAGLAQDALVANARLARLRCTADGRLITCPIAPPEDHGVTTPVALANDASAHALITAQAAGVKIALYGVDVVNLSAVVTSLIFTDAVSSVVLGRLAVPVGGKEVTWATPLKTTAASALNYALTTAAGASQVFVTPHWVITKD